MFVDVVNRKNYKRFLLQLGIFGGRRLTHNTVVSQSMKIIPSIPEANAKGDGGDFFHLLPPQQFALCYNAIVWVNTMNNNHEKSGWWIWPKFPSTEMHVELKIVP